MGVVRQLIQICVTEALRGRTIAEDRVVDSLISAVPLIMTQAPVPIIAVSIEETASGSSGGLFRVDPGMSLVLQLAVAQAVTVPGDDGDLVLGDSDAAYEASLNFMHRQILLALADPGNAWSETLRMLVGSDGFGKMSDMRLTDAESGKKYAARIIEFSLSPIAEPYPGQDDTDVVEAALTQVATIADYADLVTMFRSSLTFGSDLYDWQKVQALLMTTADVPALIGVGTPDDGSEVTLVRSEPHIEGEIDLPEPEEQPGDLSEAVTADIGDVVPGDFVVEDETP